VTPVTELPMKKQFLVHFTKRLTRYARPVLWLVTVSSHVLSSSSHVTARGRGLGLSMRLYLGRKARAVRIGCAKPCSLAS